LELLANFLLIDGRGYIPAASISQLLPRLADQAADFHLASRRLFIGSSQLHFSAELRHAPSRLVLSFSAPVNPSSVIEKGRVRLLFRREALVGNGADNVSYSDPFLQSISFTESPAGAELIANLLQPATVSIGDGGRTVTILAVPAAAPPLAASVPPPVPSSAAPSANQPHPAQRPRPFVILDAAHGGFDTGSLLSATIQEKTVTLTLARRLQKELEARGISVVLTRAADNLLTWDQRAISANTSHAALYIALHASASGHGVRFYTSMIPSSPPGQTKRSFLPWELAQAPYLDESSSAASALAAECTSAGLPVRSSTAPLRPLNSVTAAAVAVEISPFGSDADELGTPEYQQKVAAALASGIAALRGKLGDAQ
jgi:N-acetylmuramoyl-L-alanine amidase